MRFLASRGADGSCALTRAEPSPSRQAAASPDPAPPQLVAGEFDARLTLSTAVEWHIGARNQPPYNRTARNSAQRKALELDNAAKENRAVQAHAAAANSTAERLRVQIAEYAANANASSSARRARERAATLARSAAASDPIGVLASVLGRCDARAGTLAEYADRAQIAGKACERSYAALAKP